MFDYAVTEHLSISFQRYAYPADGTVRTVPPSLGALPICGGPDGLTVPGPAGEAFWIGLLTGAGFDQTILVGLLATGSEGSIDAASGEKTGEAAPVGWFRVPAQRRIVGIFRSAGVWWALAREAASPGAPSCRSLTLLTLPERSSAEADEAAVLPISLAEPASFEATCREYVPPLQPDSGYKGWRLP